MCRQGDISVTLRRLSVGTRFASLDIPHITDWHGACITWGRRLAMGKWIGGDRLPRTEAEWDEYRAEWRAILAKWDAKGGQQ